MIKISHRDIMKLSSKASILKRLRNITNEISANLIYLERNREQQNEKYAKALITKEQLDILNNAWQLKKKLAEELIQELKELIDKYDKK